MSIIKNINNIVKKYYHKYKSRNIRSLYANNQLSYQSLSKITYGELSHLISYDITIFKTISKKIFAENIKLIKTKQKIQVAFYLYAAGIWSCDKLYKLFEDDTIFEPYIVVTRYNNGLPNATWQEYTYTVDILQKKGYRVIGVSGENPVYSNWNELGNPEIVFLLTPYSGANPHEFDIVEIPLNSLLVYLPYGFRTTGTYELLDSVGLQLCWKDFVLNSDALIEKKTHAKLGAENVVIAGHSKIDNLLFPENKFDSDKIWKIAPGIPPIGVKKIIYAPHFSIFNTTVKYGTFNMNCHDIFEFAKTHPETSWIVKPHQNLCSTTVTTGFFKSETEYYEYMSNWDALPNARTALHGTYEDIFLTSDAMIMDSSSFLLEYLILNKPLIFLRRDEQTFNDCGLKLLSGVYSINGNDIEGIYNTLTNVVLNGKDSLSEVRKAVGDELTEVYRTFENCTTSSEYIYQYLKKELR